MTEAPELILEPLTTAEANRVYAKRPRLRTTCPTCKNRGSYRWRGQEWECDCDHQKRLCKHYTLAGIGMTFMRLDWSDFVDDTVLVQVWEYLQNWEANVDRGVGIIFFGHIGTGKSMLAHLVLKELVKRGVRSYATLFSTTIEEFTKTWGNPEHKQWFADTFMLSEALLIDELGREMRANNNLPQSTFDHILRTRVHDSRPTFIDTNIEANELDVAGYGAGVLSLIKGNSVLIDMKGADYRLNSKNRTFTEIAEGEVRPIV